MDFIVENKSEVINMMSFADVIPGTLMRDLLAATARGEVRNNGPNVHVDNQYNALFISELRKMAHEKGLSVDGSREMLIAALISLQEAGVGAEEGSEELDEEPDVE